MTDANTLASKPATETTVKPDEVVYIDSCDLCDGCSEVPANCHGVSDCTYAKQRSFEHAVRPLMYWLNITGNAHPHMHAVIDSTSAELSEGLQCLKTLEYLRD